MVVVEGPVTEWMNRARAEYLEMPGLSLTTSQMRILVAASLLLVLTRPAR